MKLWTIQPLEVWNELQSKGYFVCDSEKSDFIKSYKCFKDSYDWLVGEMEKRVGKRPKGINYPIWAWYIRDWKYKKPDLRESGYGLKGENLVCIEIEKKDRDVVLTDFDTWHFVLNNGYIDKSISEKEWEKNMAWFDSLPIRQQEKLKKESWQEIFNITPFKNDWMQRGRYVQATFWYLSLQEVQKIQIFKAR